MSAVMRAQVSLQFDDEDLFNNFIIPCKDQRLLNGIIVKCLKAYYTNSDVRDTIEGVGLEDVTDAGEVTSTQSICDSIRASLVMQDYLVEELKQTVEDGREDVESILSQANKHAEDKGFGSSYTTKSGSTILQLEAPKVKSDDDSKSSVDGATATAPDSLASTLCKAVLMLAKDLNNSRVTDLLQQVMGSATTVTPTEVTETARQTPVSEVHSPVENVTNGFVEKQEVVVPEGGNDFDSSDASGGEDALSALQDLFSSL